MLRRLFLWFPAQLSEEWARRHEEEFTLTYRDFVGTMNAWLKKYADGVFDKKLWDRGDTIWQKLRKFK